MVLRSVLAALFGNSLRRRPTALRSLEFESLGTREALTAAPLAMGMEFAAEVGGFDGGVLFGMGDGSVRRLSATVSLPSFGTGRLAPPVRNTAGVFDAPLELERVAGAPRDAASRGQTRQTTMVVEMAAGPVTNGDDVVVDGRIITAGDHDSPATSGSLIDRAETAKAGILLGPIILHPDYGPVVPRR
jgi:hypothetical protein